MVVGTHALLQERVRFADLGLVVIDEQHRFGVEQRGQLEAKAGGTAPHVLLMTATPIPRTLGQVLYADLDVLASRGITCPQPVKNKGGGMLGTVAGRPAAIITFLDGMWIRRPSATHCAALGAALAKLHLAGLDFGQTRANTLSVDGWRPLYDVAARGRTRCSATCSRSSPPN